MKNKPKPKLEPKAYQTCKNMKSSVKKGLKPRKIQEHNMPNKYESKSRLDMNKTKT